MPEIAQRAKISYERKPKTLHSFFALKFHDGDEDRAKVEAIESASVSYTHLVVYKRQIYY